MAYPGSTSTVFLGKTTLIFIPSFTDLISQPPLQLGRPDGYACPMRIKQKLLGGTLRNAPWLKSIQAHLLSFLFSDACLMAGDSASILSYKAVSVMAVTQ